MTDTDLPRRVRRGVPAQRDVAAGVDREVGVAAGFEDAGGTFDGPAFDVAGRVERRAVGRWYRIRVEGTVGVDSEVLTVHEYAGDFVVDVVDVEFATAEPGDRAVRDVRTERLVD